MKLGIYGSGGLGREVYDIARRRSAISSLWQEIIFINDFEEEKPFLSTRMVHFETIIQTKDAYECVIAVGEPSAREMLYKKIIDNKVRLATLIDPTALVSPGATIGKGSIICEFSTIHCGVEIGDNCLVQPYCCIGHDIRIGSHSVLSPYFAPGGSAIIGNRVFCGMHSSIKEGLTVGDNAIVAMGSAVFRDVAPGTVVVGNPARVTRGNDEGKVFK